MALITDYATLQTAVADYLAKSNLTSFIPNFVQNAENKIYRKQHLREEERELYVRIEGGFAEVPSDFKKMKQAYYEGSPIRPLNWMELDALYQKYPLRSGAEPPCAISRQADKFVFGPAPADGILRGVYYKKQPAARSAVTNLLLNSEDFTTTWTVTRATAATSAGQSPDYAREANSLSEDATAANTHFAEQTFSGTDNQTYTFSCHFTASNRSHVRLALLDRAGVTATVADFDIGKGAFMPLPPNGDNDDVPVHVEKLQFGWFRFGFTGNVGVGGTSEGVQIYLHDGSGTIFDGLNQESIKLWGAQLETGSTMSQYVRSGATQGSVENWYLENAPEVLLYASLLEAQPFIMNDPRIPIWQAYLADALDSLDDATRDADTGMHLVAQVG